MSAILFTGVTGQVGSSVAPLLQEKGHRVLYLIRPSQGKDAKARLREVIGQVGENAIAISGDVTLPNAGISESDRNEWKGKIDKIVHGAASIKFDEAVAEETRCININGTRNMLALADELGVTDFHYISTAYIAGGARTFAETDFNVGQTTRNAYESSKRESEQFVRRWRGGKFTVHRLAIVIGDSKTAEVNAFNGYYGFFIPFWRLLKTMRHRWEIEPEECVKFGIKFDRDDFLELPLCMDCSSSSTLNLVTSDWVSRTLSILFDMPSNGKTYHVINPNPPRVQWVIETSLRLLGIKGLRCGENLEFPARSLLGSLQSGLDRGLNRFRPYITHEPVFKCDNLKRVLREYYIPPPTINEALLAKMLDFAKSVNFGQKIRQPVNGDGDVKSLAG